MKKLLLMCLIGLTFGIPSALVAQQDTTAVDVAEEHQGLMKYYLRGSEAKAAGQLEDSRKAFGTTAHVLTCALPPGLMPYTCALGRDVLHVNGTAPFTQYDEPDDPPSSVIVEIVYEK